MKVGILKENFVDNVVSLEGRIRTYAVDLKFKLAPIDARRTADSPTHEIIGQGVHGGSFSAGVAWKKQTDEQKNYFTMTFEVPEIWEKELRLVAWENSPGEFDIQHSKPKAEVPQQAAA